MSNTGGAWDNAKKYIERATPDSDLQGKGSDIHKVGAVKDRRASVATNEMNRERDGVAGGNKSGFACARLTDLATI